MRALRWETKETGNETSWRDFCSYAATRSADEPYLYRGQGSSDWRLVPSLFREGSATKEIELRRESLNRFFAQTMPQFISEYCVFNKLRDEERYEILTWITIAQHYGLPTPLLDWTWSPIIALFFAHRFGPKGTKAYRIYRVNINKRDEKKIAIVKPKPVMQNLRYIMQQGAFLFCISEAKIESTRGKIREIGEIGPHAHISSRIIDEIETDKERGSWLQWVDIKASNELIVEIGCALQAMNVKGQVLFPDSFEEVVRKLDAR